MKCGLGDLQEHFERAWLRKAARVAEQFSAEQEAQHAQHAHHTAPEATFSNDWADLVWQSVHMWRNRGGGAPTTQAALVHNVRLVVFCLILVCSIFRSSKNIELPYLL